MRRVRQRASEETGQALVMTVMFMAVLLGAAALTLDVGRMTVTRRHMQNVADSSALAGAWSLPSGSNPAINSATAWAIDSNKYDIEASELMVVDVVTTSRANDSVRVDVQRNVPYIFARALGLDSQGISATATAQMQALTGCVANQGRCFPFAIWGGNPGERVQVGDPYRVFRSNQWERSSNIDPRMECGKPQAIPGCTWDVSGTQFNGYFHWQNGFNIYIDDDMQTFSQGGNAVGTHDIDALEQAYLSGTPILLPVIGRAQDPTGNDIRFEIIDFVCIRITTFDRPQGRDWGGEVVRCATTGPIDGPFTSPSGSSWTVRLVR